MQEGVDSVIISKIKLSYIMQVLVKPFKIEEEDRKQSLLTILSDHYCRQILDSVMHKPKTALEINMETRIPISTIYRRLQTLVDAKLLVTSGFISEAGKRNFLYKSSIAGIKTSFDNGRVDVELVFNQ